MCKHKKQAIRNGDVYGIRDIAIALFPWEVTLNGGGTIVWADTESDGAERLAKLRRNDWLSWIPGVQEACGQ